MEKLRTLDLFAGIGGFSLGLERTGGFTTVAFCEIEKFPQQVLRKHWPEVPIYDDVRTLTAERLAADGIAVDVITGGFPCQDLSACGSGAGLAGERSGLWFEYARLIRELRPRYVIVENSPNLLDWLGPVLGALAEVGLDAEWECIPAGAIGAPHFRDRLWIVAYAPCERLSGQGELITSLNQEAAPYRQASELERAFRAGNLPYVCGGHDGVSTYVDQVAVKSLGNAVVPQIVELIGRAILQAEQDLRRVSLRDAQTGGEVPSLASSPTRLNADPSAHGEGVSA
jgi:DNA (cytosine-5)-methyltransferase 1